MIKPDFMKQFATDDPLSDKDKAEIRMKAKAINQLLDLSADEFLSHVANAWDEIGETAVKVCISGMVKEDINDELQNSLLLLSFRCHAVTKLINMVRSDIDDEFDLSPVAMQEVKDECKKLITEWRRKQ